ncbi:MAG: host specificity protein [Alphaproteobacteria bacterium]|nr:host specificity protein [Alphaproteobacteria bacterium]
MKNLAFWMSTPYFAHFEIARDMGFAAVVLDVEHGTFGLDDLDRLIPFCHGIGLKVYAKVLGPQVEAVQQALDFGADGVIIPHIGDIEHAAKVCAAAKFPPVGLRSSAGWRPTGYKRSDDAYFAEQNRRVKCWPMIESAEAMADAEKIAALPTVDGLFAGPTDLSMTRGRGAYKFTDADRTDLARIAAAAQKAGKEWVFPAWTQPERAFAAAQPLNPCLMVVGAQNAIIRSGFAGLLDGLKKEGVI